MSFIFSHTWAQLPFHTSLSFLDKNYVKAGICTANNKFWSVGGLELPQYEVPKGKGTYINFASSIWIAGLDGLGQLHASANTFRQSHRTDFWAGPLDTSNITAFTTSNSAVYNRLWKVDCDEINAFANAFNSGAIAAGTYTIPSGILYYPAKGIYHFQKNLEQFADANNNNQYNPAIEGDYPIIKGQQQILSIYNDNYLNHTETQAPSMGLEIHEKAYVYFQPAIADSMQALNYSTFYHFTIYNRSNVNYSQVMVSQWIDADLGYALDDYVGTDTVNKFSYIYNSANIDPNNGTVPGYGNKPPVVSYALLKTNCSNDGIDNDADGFTDEPGESFVLNRSTYFNLNSSTTNTATIDPSINYQYYNYMTGSWRDNSPFTFGGNAYGGTAPAKYIFPGDPETNSGWTEGTANNPTGDRRMLLSSGPFNFPAHSKIEIGFAIIFSQDTVHPINTITKFDSIVRRDVRNVIYYDSAHQTPFCLPAITAAPNGISKINLPELKAMIYPNPGKSQITVDLSENVKNAQIDVYDVTGRKVLSQKINDGYRGQIDVSDLPEGLYIVEIEADGRMLKEKFVRH